MISWPSDLPQQPNYGHSKRLVSGLSSETDELSPRRTRTYPDYEATYEFRQLTLTQFTRFRVFYDEDLNQRAPFSAPWLPAAGFPHHFCQFAEAPTAQRNNGRFDVTVSLRIISGVPETDGEISYGDLA